jgi:uncharacterized protein (TIGR02145 family)
MSFLCPLNDPTNIELIFYYLYFLLTLLLNLMNVNKLIYLPLLLFILLLSSCDKSTSIPIYIDGKGIIDAEGNSYKTVIIGDQEWMAENLRTDLFCSGDSIPFAGDTIQVKVYDNDPKNEAIFGKLYNYQAVLNPSGVCPCGWQVPTELEYAKLINYLGGYQSAMTAMKSSGVLEDGTGLWAERKPTGLYDGTNSSGFNALPGGYSQDSEFLNNEFFDKDSLAAFWAIPQIGTAPISYQILTPQVDKLYHPNPLVGVKIYYSIRCIKTFP